MMAIENIVEQALTTLMWSHAKDIRISVMMVRRVFNKEGGKVLGDVEEAPHDRKNSTTAPTTLSKTP